MAEFLDLLDKFIMLCVDTLSKNGKSKEDEYNITTKSLKTYRAALVHFKTEQRTAKATGKFEKLSRTMVGLNNLLLSIGDIIKTYDYDDNWLRMSTVKHVFYHYTLTSDGALEPIRDLAVHISNIYDLILSVYNRYEFMRLLFSMFAIVCEDAKLKAKITKIIETYESKIEKLPEAEIDQAYVEVEQSNDFEGMLSKITDGNTAKLGKGVETAMKQLGLGKMLESFKKSGDDDSDEESEEEDNEEEKADDDDKTKNQKSTTQIKKIKPSANKK